MLAFFRPRALGVALVLATVTVGGPAWAAPTDEERANARAAATAGATAMQESRWGDAADLFTRAEAVMHAPTHLLYLARAQVKLGRLVRARENYLKITREELAANAPKAFVDAQATAREEAAALESRIPNVKIVIEGEGASRANVTLDGTQMGSALTGVPFPVDPGTHKFQARTNELESEPVTVECTEGAQTVTVSLALTIKNATPEPATAVVPQAAAPAPATPADAGAQTGSSGLRTGAFIALGVGVVGLAAGTVFLLQNRSKRNEANDLCTANGCPLSKQTEIQGLDSSASSAATLSWVGYGVGVAGLAAGAALYIMSSPKGEAGKKRGQLTPILTGTAHGGYVGMGGTF